MELRNLGPSGLRVSAVGLGCNNFGGRIDLAATRAVVHRALDAGITLFDTSDSYGKDGGSELALGETLGDRRKDIVLASKFGSPMGAGDYMRGGSRRYITQGVEASLRRLKTDWIDLYQFHKPDPLTPMEETLRALDDLVRQGKVRYIGVSNHKGWQVVDARWISTTRNLESFVSCQDEYSLLVRGIEKELLPAMQAHGLGLLPYFPLASGLLTGKYRQGEAPPAGTRFAGGAGFLTRYWTDGNWKKIDALEAFAAARGKTLLELAFSWLACRPCVSSVIAGATRPEQIDANISAASWVLDAGEMDEVNRITS
jgi:aryl-alcohol dehydrogenase-like predicted oxidoreductase